MPNNQLIRTHETVSYDAGSTQTIDLPRSHFYERLNLVMDWDVTVNTAGTPQNGAGILDLIEDISVKFNGNKTPKSTGLALSHFIDWYQYGTRPVYDAVDLSTASQQTGQVQTFVDFLVHPGQYGAMLPSFEFSDLTLSIKWADASAIADDVSVNDATVAIESTERKKRSVPTKNRPLSAILDALSGFKETERTRPLTVQGETTIELPRGNTYYAVPMLVLDNDAPSNSLVEDVVVEEDGVSTHKDTTFDLLRANDKEQYGIEDRPDGFAYLNYGIHGNLDDTVPTRNMDAFELTVDTGSTTPTDPAEVRYVTQELVR
jgi:hypothetical protein